ncbi:hypothetical protein AJ88_46020 [Mesorhizobium amorphae CCBAU 01583]|nr:hypothetical protein AJ88_46020 [Mesorhizobium amorphae CCBAU 01583]
MIRMSKERYRGPNASWLSRAGSAVPTHTGATNDLPARQLNGLVDQAHALLEPYGEQAVLLKEAAKFVATRNS